MRPSKGIRIRRSDLLVTYVRSGGPGGQHKNKRLTGVRIKHLPTGIGVSAVERRMRSVNEKVAMERLTLRLEDYSHVPAERHQTKPSKASKEQRLSGKRARSQTKKLRRCRSDDWE